MSKLTLLLFINSRLFFNMLLSMVVVMSKSSVLLST